MIVPSDPDYVDTKRVKLGKKTLPPVFRELADWIAGRWPGVTILNLYYDKTNGAAGRVFPRLNVIFERQDERFLLFFAGMNFDPAKQAAVAERFTAILASHPEARFDTRNLLVIFTAFEPVARIEATWKVSAADLSRLQAELNTTSIWTIRPKWTSLVVFFHTDAELKSLCDTRFKAACARAYGKIIAEYDEFGYFRENPPDIAFDSKENFETTYQGNWFYYDR